jgi:ADP-ribose pyrophosphatase
MSEGGTAAGAEGPGRLERREVHHGRVVKLSVDRVRFPDGSEGELELIRHVGAAAVVPFLDSPTDPDPRVLLVRQYRYASGGYLYEVPAGLPDSANEEWSECAHRELAEETGYRAGELRYMTRIYTTPGFTNEVIHIFGAAALEGGTSDHDHDEFIEVVAMRLSEAIERVRVGEIVDGKSVAAFLFADRFRVRAWTEARAAPPRNPFPGGVSESGPDPSF